MDMQIKNNPFVKVSPTTKHYKMLENCDTKIRIKILSKCTDVPYCDTFAVDEELLILSPATTSSYCIVRQMCQVTFYKSTIFKGKIESSAIKGAKQVVEDF